jgi:3-deoxy-D-manno-octulosonic-acid transferase
VRAIARVLYAVAAKLAGVASAVVPPSDSKAVIAVRARHNIRARYTRWASEHRDATRPLLWVHAPSVGEGLQARPVLTLARDRHPELQLAYTFFSPSAEEFSRTLNVDFRDYLPFDWIGDMGVALDALRPRALVFSKLDLWPELVRQANKRAVKVGMISATLAAGSGRRGALAGILLRDAYAMLDAVGAVDPADAERLVQLGVRAEVIEVTGDTRFDQVWQKAQHVDRAAGLLHRLSGDRPTLVAGSTWPADEIALLPGFEQARGRVRNLRIILAPHEPTAGHLAPIEEWARRVGMRIARVDSAEAATADVVLVDRFGLLGELYALADAAFVGGGFHSAGLHSVLEPAAFGAPVLFGPQHHNSRDASLMLAAGAARVVSDWTQVREALESWFGDSTARQQAGAKARDTVQGGTGAAERSLKLVERLLG